MCRGVGNHNVYCFVYCLVGSAAYSVCYTSWVRHFHAITVEGRLCTVEGRLSIVERRLCTVEARLSTVEKINICIFFQSYLSLTIRFVPGIIAPRRVKNCSIIMYFEYLFLYFLKTFFQIIMIVLDLEA